MLGFVVVQRSSSVPMKYAIHTLMPPLATGKELILFDLDGTLCVSKTPLDTEMFELLKNLLAKKSVAIISGGSYSLFQTQLKKLLKGPQKYIEQLYLFPTSGSVFCRFENGWKEQYAELLTSPEREKIFTSFARAFEDIGYTHPDKLYGEVIEDRRTQVSFSALGQKTPVMLKRKWREKNPKTRMKIKLALERYLPEFEIRVAGMTTIDVTHKGIDKAYGINKIEQTLGFKKEQMLFFGDSLFEGGNDYPVQQAGVESCAVSGPDETKKYIRQILREHSRSPARAQ